MQNKLRYTKETASPLGMSKASSERDRRTGTQTPPPHSRAHPIARTLIGCALIGSTLLGCVLFFFSKREHIGRSYSVLAETKDKANLFTIFINDRNP
jgi:hypothetical protein